MRFESELALLIAVALALVRGDRWGARPRAGLRAMTRMFAKDLPAAGRWALPAGVLLVALVGGLAVAAAWFITFVIPLGVQLGVLGAAPYVRVILAAAVLGVAIGLPAQPHGADRAPHLLSPRERTEVRASWWRGRPGRETSDRRDACPTSCPSPGSPSARRPLPAGEAWQRPDFTIAYALEFVAPVLLYAFLGLYAAVAYRAVLETARALEQDRAPIRLALPALGLAYLPAAPAQRLVLLFSALAASRARTRNREAMVAGVCAVALALLVMIW